MLSLNADQAVALEVELIRLQARGVITDDQRTQIVQAILGIELTAEEVEYERRATIPRHDTNPNQGHSTNSNAGN